MFRVGGMRGLIHLDTGTTHLVSMHLKGGVKVDAERNMQAMLLTPVCKCDGGTAKAAQLTDGQIGGLLQSCDITHDCWMTP